MSRRVGWVVFTLLSFALFVPRSLMGGDPATPWVGTTTGSFLTVAAFALYCTAFNRVWRQWTGKGLTSRPSAASHPVRTRSR